MFEQCLYDAHVRAPNCSALPGAKGAGQAATAGVSAVVMNANHNALRRFDAAVFLQAFTAEKILRSLGKRTGSD